MKSSTVFREICNQSRLYEWAKFTKKNMQRLFFIGFTSVALCAHANQAVAPIKDVGMQEEKAVPHASSGHGHTHNAKKKEQSCEGESCVKAKFSIPVLASPPNPPLNKQQYEKIMRECVSNVGNEDMDGIKLLAGLGDSKYPLVSLVDVSKQSHSVEAFYSQGMILQYGFNFPRAIRSFYKALKLDESAAMAYWGVALSANSNINSAATSGCDRLAYVSVQFAKFYANSQLKNTEYINKFTPAELQRQVAYAKAFDALYQVENSSNPPMVYITQKTSKDHVSAMKELASTYNLDLDAAVLYADALLNITPWKWWQGVIEKSDHVKPTHEAALALEVLNKILIQNPKHIGANHFFIHAIEESPFSDSGVPMAERLKTLAPSSGHLVHMSSHIHQRIGDNAGSSADNIRAVQVDRAYMDQVKTDDTYPLHYLGHNIHFLIWTLSVEGRENDALIMAKELVDNTAQYAPNKYLCTNFPEEIKVKTDYYFASALYFTVRFQNEKYFNEINKLINLAFDKIKTVCENSPVIGGTDWKSFDIPYTKMIRAYGNVYFGNSSQQRDNISKFWQQTRAAFYKNSKLQFGTNDAINLIRIANLNLVNLWLNNNNSDNKLAGLEELMRRDLGINANHALDDPNVKILYLDTFCKNGNDNDCIFWKQETPGENIIRLWKNAVMVQDHLNYNEPPDWYYTNRESLGFAYLKQATSKDTPAKSSQKYVNDAELIFQQDLMNNRLSGRSLCGLKQSLELQGESVSAQLEQDFSKAWKNANISADMNQKITAQPIAPICPSYKAMVLR